jgi:hypothetical protein
MKFALLPLLFFLVGLLTAPANSQPAQTEADVVVYGGTPAGVAAAVAAAREGRSVVLVEPNPFVGGMMAGGLTKTDLGDRETIGGISREFFARILDYYKKTFGADSIQAEQTKEGAFFEPSVAGKVFAAMLDETGVRVILRHRIEDATVAQGRLRTVDVVPTAGGDPMRLAGKVFVDASYEGDLMAAAGVPYRVGREARAEYNEPLAGMTAGPADYLGKGDHRPQAYNIRSTITRRPDIRVPFPKPAHYDPRPHEGFISAVKKHGFKSFEELFHDVPLWGEVNGKMDPNKADAVGLNFNYAEADPIGRAAIVERVRDHWLSLWYMLGNDPRLPEEFRRSVANWGLPADEFVESGNVTPQVYVRVARRMLGRYMLAQGDTQDERFKDDAICLGSYNIDSHEIQRILLPGGPVAEGFIIQGVDPYEIPYRVITPFAPSNLLVVCAVSATHIAYGTLRMEPVFMMIGEAAGRAANLAIKTRKPVQEIDVKELQEQLRAAGTTLAAPFRPKAVIQILTPPPFRPGQEISFRADLVRERAKVDRLEWNFDGSGEVQASGPTVTRVFPVAGRFPVSLAIEDADKNQGLLATAEVAIGDAGAASPVEVTFADAKAQGRWDRGGSGLMAYRDRTAYHDMNDGKGEKSVSFTADLPADGIYQVAIAYAQDANRASRVPVRIEHADGTAEVLVDQRAEKSFAFAPLGTFRFEKAKPARVTVTNDSTDGYVSVDAVRWIAVR